MGLPCPRPSRQSAPPGRRTRGAHTTRPPRPAQGRRLPGRGPPPPTCAFQTSGVRAPPQELPPGRRSLRLPQTSAAPQRPPRPVPGSQHAQRAGLTKRPQPGAPSAHVARPPRPSLDVGLFALPLPSPDSVCLTSPRASFPRTGHSSPAAYGRVNSIWGDVTQSQRKAPGGRKGARAMAERTMGATTTSVSRVLVDCHALAQSFSPRQNLGVLGGMRKEQ